MKKFQYALSNLHLAHWFTTIFLCVSRCVLYWMHCCLKNTCSMTYSSSMTLLMVHACTAHSSPEHDLFVYRHLSLHCSFKVSKWQDALHSKIQQTRYTYTYMPLTHSKFQLLFYRNECVGTQSYFAVGNRNEKTLTILPGGSLYLLFVVFAIVYIIVCAFTVQTALKERTKKDLSHISDGWIVTSPNSVCVWT